MTLNPLVRARRVRVQKRWTRRALPPVIPSPLHKFEEVLLTKSDSLFSVHFPQNPKLTAEDMLDIQFDASTTTIKTADLTYEGSGIKSSDLCGILGFVDDQGHIHLSSNFDVYTMRPKLTDFNLTSEQNSNHEENKLNVRHQKRCFHRERKTCLFFIIEN